MNGQEHSSRIFNYFSRIRNIILKFIFAAFTDAYTFMLGRPSMQWLNDRFLELALHGRGYNNCCDPRKTGEEIFIKLISMNSPSLCLDIGANIGIYSESLLKITSAKVIAFEPLPDSYLKLNDLELKYPKRFQAINKGVSDKNQTALIYYGSATSSHATFSLEVNEIPHLKPENINEMKVEAITLDSFFEGRSDLENAELTLIKIDTEGYEWEVLSGAKETLKKYKPKFIQIEFDLHQLYRK
jgi:FkbM family methyltransferase